VLYAKSWTAPSRYGDPAAEAELRAPLRSWCVDEPWFAGAAPDCRFMHCLPVRRNVVVADQVLDGPRSAVIQEARNRMWVQMAVLHRMLAAIPATQRVPDGRGQAPPLRPDRDSPDVGAGLAPARFAEGHEP